MLFFADRRAFINFTSISCKDLWLKNPNQRDKTKNKKGMPLSKQKHEGSVPGIPPLALASSVAWKQTHSAVSYVALFHLTFLLSTIALRRGQKYSKEDFR